MRAMVNKSKEEKGVRQAGNLHRAYMTSGDSSGRRVTILQRSETSGHGTDPASLTGSARRLAWRWARAFHGG